MSIPSILTKIKNPLGQSRKIYGLVILALLGIGSLGVAYYFHIISNQENFKQNQYQLLDSYYKKISKHIDYLIVREYSQNNQSADSICEKFNHKQVEEIIGSLTEFNEFDEYFISFSSYDLSNCLSNSIKESSFKNILHKFKFDSLLGNVAINEVQHLSFPGKYVYQSELVPEIEFEIYLIGFVKASKYEATTRKFDPLFVAILIILLFLALIGLPFFKLIFISEDERLTSTDVILAGITTILGVPVIIILFLSLHNYAENYFITIPSQLKELSAEINRRFYEENNDIVKQLKNFDIEKYEKYSKIIVNKTKTKTTFLDNIKTAFIEYEDRDSIYKQHFKFISKVSGVSKSNTNNSGDVEYHVNFIKAPEKSNSGRTNIGKRAYFKDYLSGSGIWNANGQDYVMRSMVGIADGKEEAVYILKNDSDDYYKVGSVQLQSIHQPILPFGYEFAIINPEGEVQFHSQKGRATYENLYAVSNRYENLKAAVNGRINVNGTLFYHGIEYKFDSRPIKGTNLSVIVFYKLKFLRLKITEALSISIMALFVATFLLAFLTIISVFLRKPKISLMKFNHFYFEYLCPKKEKINSYIILICFFVLCCFLLLISPIKLNPGLAFNFSLLIVVWSYAIVYYALNSKQIVFNFKDIMLLAIILLLNIFLCKSASSNEFFIFLSVQIVLTVLIGLNYVKGIGNHLKFSSKTHLKLKYIYTWFIFSWLMLAIVFPTYLFFSKANSVEEHIWIKTNQYHIAKAYNKKMHLIRQGLMAVNHEKEMDRTYALHLKNGLYVHSNFNIKKQKRDDVTVQSPTFLRKLLWSSRPIYDEKIRNYQAMIFQFADDGTWHSRELDTINYFSLSKNGHTVKNSIVKKDTFRSDGILSITGLFILLKWGGLIAVLVIFFYLILFYVYRIFAFRFQYISTIDFNNNQSLNSQLSEILYSNKTNIGFLLIGVPFSGKSLFVKKIIAASEMKNKVMEISFFWLDQNKQELKVEELIESLIMRGYKNQGINFNNWEDKEIFVLKNLEHNYNSFETNRLKLRIISFLFSKNKKVIITSEIYPSQILSFYTNQIDHDGRMNNEMNGDYIAWRNVLSSFYQLIIGLKHQEIETFKDEVESQLNQDSVINTKIKNEIAYGNFLPALNAILVKNNTFLTQNSENKKQLDEEKMILHVLHHSHGYYTDIWNGLSPRERYMLHDLAQDGFMNIKNTISLFSLMKKGLVVWRDRPHIFNQSFRNFIIYSVPKSEALKFEIKKRDQGSWGTVRIVIFLVILTVLVFIVLGEPEIFENFEGFYGALAGLGAIIPIVSSLLARGGKY